jgi:DNA-binding phage protein
MRLELGNQSNLKRIGTITEYRVNWGPGYRIYLPEDCDAWVLLGGGTKRRQREDIERAKALFAGFSRRKIGRQIGRTQEVNEMGLTRDFKEAIVERVRRDPDFAKALLDEAATAFLNGEPQLTRLILRDLVNATLGFEGLALKIAKPAKSLHRMLSKQGNPSMDNLAAILGALREELGVELQAHTIKAA